MSYSLERDFQNKKNQILRDFYSNTTIIRIHTISYLSSCPTTSLGYGYEFLPCKLPLKLNGQHESL